MSEQPEAEVEERPDATVGVDPQKVLNELKDRLAATPRHIRPLDHAALQYAVGMAYAELPTGERELNLARALTHYDNAGKLFTRERFVVEHARVQNARGAALRELGEHARAREALEDALALLRAVDDPQRTAAEYGAALNNLGLVLSGEGDHEAAMRVMGDAVKAFGHPDHVRQRLMARYNLAQAQAEAGYGEDAVESYRAGIEDTDPEQFPYQYALLQHGLGVSLTALDRPQEAAAAFTRSLLVFTRPRYPFQHALAKNNLGLAYAQIGGDEDLRRAIVAFEDAARVLDPRVQRDLWSQVARNRELAEKALEERGLGGTRFEHFIALVASIDDKDERVAIMRERLMSVFALPEGARMSTLVEHELATLRLPDPGPHDVTGAWLDVLMELPNPQVVEGLQARLYAMDKLESAAELTRAGEMLEMVIREELLAPQRIRVRDTLEHLGYERKW